MLAGIRRSQRSSIPSLVILKVIHSRGWPVPSILTMRISLLPGLLVRPEQDYVVCDVEVEVGGLDCLHVPL